MTRKLWLGLFVMLPHFSYFEPSTVIPANARLLTTDRSRRFL